MQNAMNSKMNKLFQLHAGLSPGKDQRSMSPKSNYLGIFGSWVEALRDSFKPFFFSGCIIEEKCLFAEVKLLEAARKIGNHERETWSPSPSPPPPGYLPINEFAKLLNIPMCKLISWIS